MKKLFMLAAVLAVAVGAKAQNIQLHYDLGHSLYNELGETKGNRAPLTTTVEMFRADRFGSTFFFVDMDYNSGVQGSYWEVSREINLWQSTPLAPISFHLEYNGGANNSVGAYNNSWLTGLTYSGHNADFSKTWSVSAMYKYIPGTIGLDGTKQENNFQFTGVWNISLAGGWVMFSGFIDFWREARPWQQTEFILLSEPQLWVNLNKIASFKDINLSVGGEVEISNNFVAKGFYAIPTLAAKWTF